MSVDQCEATGSGRLTEAGPKGIKRAGTRQGSLKSVLTEDTMPSGLVRAGAMWGAAALALVLAGQIYLQLFDKLLLGVIIAAAFVAYDRYKDADAKRFQKEMAQLNNRMEQER